MTGLDAAAKDYRKRPIIVQAVHLTASNIEKVAEWCGGDHVREHAYEIDAPDFEYIEIVTLEGTMRADPGDYVIRGVKGEFYPCKPDIFEQTYEAV